MYDRSNEGNYHRFNRNFRAPVKVGEVLEVTIEAKGEKGDGLTKKDGFVIFVPNTSTGDHVKIKINKVLRKVAFGEVVGDEESTNESNEEESDSKENEDESTESSESNDETSKSNNDDKSYEDSEDF